MNNQTWSQIVSEILDTYKEVLPAVKQGQYDILYEYVISMAPDKVEATTSWRRRVREAAVTYINIQNRNTGSKIMKNSESQEGTLVNFRVDGDKLLCSTPTKPKVAQKTSKNVKQNVTTTTVSDGKTKNSSKKVDRSKALDTIKVNVDAALDGLISVVQKYGVGAFKQALIKVNRKIDSGDLKKKV